MIAALSLSLAGAEQREFLAMGLRAARGVLIRLNPERVWKFIFVLWRTASVVCHIRIEASQGPAICRRLLMGEEDWKD